MDASIIIPTRNMGDLLKNTLKALILELHGNDAEIIVVDDSSKDNTKNIVKEFGVKYIYMKHLPGIMRMAAQARNLGAKHAKGRVLVFLDSDMVVSPGFLSAHIKAHENADVVLGLRIEKSDREKSETDARERYFTICDDDIDKLPAKWSLLYSHNFSVKKKDFESAGEFSTAFDKWGAEDLELGFRLKNKKFALCRKCVAKHQKHETEYKSSLEKKINLIKNAEIFYSLHESPEVYEFFRMDRHVLRVSLSDKCNNNCSHCKKLGQKGYYLDTQELLKQLSLLPKKFRVQLCGSEPTIRKDFLALVKQISLEIELQTNARTLSYISFCRKCAEHIDNYMVFLYGYSSDIHDSITNAPGSFAQTIKGMDNLIALDKNIAIQLVITKENHKHYKDMLKFAGKYTNNIYVRLAFPNITLIKKIMTNPHNKFNVDNVTYIDPVFQCIAKKSRQLSIKQVKSCQSCIVFDKCRGKPWEL